MRPLAAVLFLTFDLLRVTIQTPYRIAEGHTGRKIYQKKTNGYIVRVIIEEHEAIKRVITVYRAKGGRYGI